MKYHEDGSTFGVGLFIGALSMGVLLVIILLSEADDWETEAIRHNAAQYNPTTGAFEWLPTEEENNNEE